MNWTYCIVAKDDTYEYRITDHREHPGTFILRIAIRQTNKVIRKVNTLTSVEEAQDAARGWAEAKAKQANP